MIASHLRTTVLACSVLLLSGCAPAVTAPTAADEPVPQAGQCLAASVETVAGDVVPDHTSITPCTEPHRYAVIAAIAVPSNLLTGKSVEELLQNRADLLGADAEAAAEYDAWSAGQCEAALADTVGIDAVTIAGVDAATARMAPVGAFSLAHSLTEEPHWASGAQSLVCAVRWLDPADASTPVSLSLPADIQLDGFFTSAFPAEARQCLVQADTTAALSPCGIAHSLEPVLSFDARAVFGADWVAEVDPASVTGQQYAELDAGCQEVVGFAVGGQNPGVTARAELMSGWANESLDRHGVYCALASAQFSRYDVTGSLVGIGDAEPQLVAAP